MTVKGSAFDHRLDRTATNLDQDQREAMRARGRAQHGRNCYVVVGGAAFGATVRDSGVRDGVLHYKVALVIGRGTAWVSEPRVLTQAEVN